MQESSIGKKPSIIGRPIRLCFVITMAISGTRVASASEPSLGVQSQAAGGACCVSDTECVEVSGTDCNQLHGWQAGTGSCNDTDCSMTGACCVFGECWTRPEANCTGPNRIFRGIGTACADPGICAGPCCLGDFECVQTDDRWECYDLLGWFRTPGDTCEQTDCTPAGACCGYGECRTLDEETCRVSELAFRGPDSNCTEPGICDEPCCLGGDECVVMGWTECWESDGYPLGYRDSECSACICYRHGACCLPSGDCVVRRDADCSAFSGETFLGGACGINSCDCKSDLDCDADDRGYCDGQFCRGLGSLYLNSFLACFTGPDVAVGNDCWCGDRTGDGKADLFDVAAIFRAARTE